MICDVINSLLVLIGKLAFFNKQSQGFIISLITPQTLNCPQPLAVGGRGSSQTHGVTKRNLGPTTLSHST